MALANFHSGFAKSNVVISARALDRMELAWFVVSREDKNDWTGDSNIGPANFALVRKSVAAEPCCRVTVLNS